MKGDLLMFLKWSPNLYILIQYILNNELCLGAYKYENDY